MSYDASSKGWLTSAWADLKAGKDFYVVLSHKSLKDIVSSITVAAQKVEGASSLLKVLSDITPGNVIPDPLDITKGLAVLGGLGAMEASFVVLSLFAHFKGYTVEVGFVIPPSTLDITECALKMSFERKIK